MRYLNVGGVALWRAVADHQNEIGRQAMERVCGCGHTYRSHVERAGIERTAGFLADPVIEQIGCASCDCRAFHRPVAL